jgi:MAF protein
VIGDRGVKIASTASEESYDVVTICFDLYFPFDRDPVSELGTPALVLASSSPYRGALLARLGLAFVQAEPDVDESRRAGEPPADYVRRLSLAKARAVAGGRSGHVLVIGADQAAELDGEVVGKPLTRAGALAQLGRASGRLVTFHCGVCLLDPASGRAEVDDVRVRVRFRSLLPAEIERYVAREPALDCAGGFKVEGLGIGLFEAVESTDPSALVGLPLIRLAAMLRGAGIQVP